MRYSFNAYTNDSLMPVTRKVRFYGRVQGVYFRRRTQQAAYDIGVSGWVRNLTDGSVEAEISGEKENVDRLVRYCVERLPVARVDRVETSDIDYIEHKGFEIRY